VKAEPAITTAELCRYASQTGVDMHLSGLETLLIGLEQRTLDPDQLERFARLLQYGERVVMGRVKVRRAA